MHLHESTASCNGLCGVVHKKASLFGRHDASLNAIESIEDGALSMVAREHLAESIRAHIMRDTSPSYSGPWAASDRARIMPYDAFKWPSHALPSLYITLALHAFTVLSTLIINSTVGTTSGSDLCADRTDLHNNTNRIIFREGRWTFRTNAEKG